MTQNVIEELRGLYEAGTKGPWRECGANRGGCTCCAVWSTSVDTHVLTTAKEGDDPEGACMVPKGEAITNAALVAAMHRHLPALLAVAEAAKAALPYINPKAIDGEKAKTHKVSECYINDRLAEALSRLTAQGTTP